MRASGLIHGQDFESYLKEIGFYERQKNKQAKSANHVSRGGVDKRHCSETRHKQVQCLQDTP